MTKQNLVILGLILALATFLRFYQLPQLAPFTFDEEHQLGLARTLVKDFHIIWIGVSASNLDFYLGPFWVYFTYVWLKLFNLDPLPTYYVASAMGIITTALLFYVGKKLFDYKTAITAGLLYASLPLIVFHNQKFWTVTAIPLLSLIMFFSLYKSLESPKWWILFFTSFGLVFHTHLSLVPLGFIGTYFFFKNRSKIRKEILFFVMLIFLIIVSPLLAFDYFHNFSNLSAVFHSKQLVSSNKIDVSTHFSYLLDYLGRIWYLRPGLSNEDEIPFVCKDAYKDKYFATYDFDSIRTKSPLWLSIISLALLLWFLLKPSTWKNSSTKILGLGLISIFGSFLLSPLGPSEYYLIGTFPLLLLLPGLLRTNLPKNFSSIVWGAVILVCLLGINTIININLNHGLGIKKKLIGEVMNVIKTAPFELYENGICHKYDGWRYLFAVYGRKPERSSTDESLGWLYPEEITNTPAKYKIIMSEAKVVPQEDISKATVIEKGGFKGYIFKLFE